MAMALRLRHSSSQDSARSVMRLFGKFDKFENDLRVLNWMSL